MLDKLYKKLHILFISGIMLIITLIIGIVGMNNIRIEKMNDSTFFQRMSMMLIYQLEDNDQSFEADIKAYEDKYAIFCSFKDEKGKLLYQSSFTYLTDIELLVEQLNGQTDSQEAITLSSQTATMQGGIYEIKGKEHDRYWGIEARIVTKSERIYDLMLLYQQPSVWESLQQQLPLYIFIWLFSLFCISFISHFVLKKALEPTECILRSQKEFVASASHELKSPLAVILANTEEVGSLSAGNPQIQKAVQIMDGECMRMSRLIKDMLLLASSDAKSWILRKSEVNVDTLLITLYETYEPICAKAKITLTLDIDEVSYPVLYTDEERILQILNIYMDNAIHHSKNNSKIEIQALLTAKDITFYVADHGQGIEKEDMPYIFDRFYCGDKSRTDKSHFGLGLSIAKELAKMLNGTAALNETPGGGATFYVTIPIK